MGHLAVLLVILLSYSVLSCETKRILLLPLFTKSHIFTMTAIGEMLVRRGHQVHMLMVNNFPLFPELAVNQSGISIIRYGFVDGVNTTDYDKLYEEISWNSVESDVDMISLILSVREILEAERRRILTGNDDLFDDMKKMKFDLAVVDSIFFTKFIYLIPHRLEIPWITLTDILNPWLIRVPWLPSFYVPQIMTFCQGLTFFDRLKNTLYSLVFFYYPLMPEPPEEILAIYRKHGSFSSLDDLMSRSLLFVIISDVVLDDALPFIPNMISAGGLTAKPANPDGLPHEFLDFVISAKSGIVVVSFGSMASSLPAPIAKRFVEAFSALPELHFIWRFKNTDLLTIPRNVMIADWLPQNDLLAHRKTKLFITHCGNNGQFEAVFHGVPMIGFPLLGDQPYNAKRMKTRGFGISMNIRKFTSDQLSENINTILSDVGYKSRISLASEIFRSALRSPAERVLDGIEHVLRFGSDHIRSAGDDLPLYQYLMLDVLGFVTLVTSVVVVVLFKMVTLVLKLCIFAVVRRRKAYGAMPFWKS